MTAGMTTLCALTFIKAVKRFEPPRRYAIGANPVHDRLFCEPSWNRPGSEVRIRTGAPSPPPWSGLGFSPSISTPVCIGASWSIKFSTKMCECANATRGLGLSLQFLPALLWTKWWKDTRQIRYYLFVYQSSIWTNEPSPWDILTFKGNYEVELSHGSGIWDPRL